MKTLLGVIAAAAVGGIIGYSQVLCPGGTCAITGSWYGGAVFGGLFAAAFLTSRPRSPEASPSEPDDANAPK